MILAGGMGSRLSEETEVRPKPMVEIGHRPILWHIMQHYSHFGFRDFVVCLGYKGEYIKKYFSDTLATAADLTIDFAAHKVEMLETATRRLAGDARRHRPDDADGRTAGAGAQASRRRDVPHDVRRRGLRRRPRRARRLPPAAREAGDDHRRAPTGPLRQAAHRRRSSSPSFEEKPQMSEGWINGGFFVLEPGVFDYIPGDVDWAREPLEDLAEDGQLAGYCHDGFWQCMDTMRDKVLLNSLWDGGAAPWKLWELVTARPGGSRRSTVSSCSRRPRSRDERGWFVADARPRHGVRSTGSRLVRPAQPVALNTWRAARTARARRAGARRSSCAALGGRSSTTSSTRGRGRRRSGASSGSCSTTSGSTTSTFHRSWPTGSRSCLTRPTSATCTRARTRPRPTCRSPGTTRRWRWSGRSMPPILSARDAAAPPLADVDLERRCSSLRATTLSRLDAVRHRDRHVERAAGVGVRGVAGRRSRRRSSRRAAASRPGGPRRAPPRGGSAAGTRASACPACARCGRRRRRSDRSRCRCC